MIVADPLKQIKEAFRVLKSNSYAGFTFIGRLENNKTHHILD